MKSFWLWRRLSSAMLVGVFVQFAASAQDPIESVSIRGVPGHLALRTRKGDAFDQRTIAKDVRILYETGRVSDVRAEVEQGTFGKRVTFHVVPSERLTLRRVRIVPETVRLKATVSPGTPLTFARAYAIAAKARTELVQQGMPEASVRPQIVPAGAGLADLVLHVGVGEQIRVGAVSITGTAGLADRQASGALQALGEKRILPRIPGLWNGWKRQPIYSEAAISSDLARIRSLFIARGYFDASVRLDHAEIVAARANLTLLIAPGDAYSVRSWQVAGSGVERKSGPVSGSNWSDSLCKCLLEERRRAEAAGAIDFAVSVSVVPPGVDSREVALSATLTRGKRYRIRRIDLVGNRSISDSKVHRNLLLDEGEPLDSWLLRRSIDRLNRTSLFEEMDERDVAIATDEQSGLADIRIQLRERQRISWQLSGPVGPLSLGSLQFSVASRLPAWGRGLLDTSSWYGSLTLLGYRDPLSAVTGRGSTMRLLSILALQRPFMPSHSWTSGISIAPQLGWRGTLTSYARQQLLKRGLSALRTGDVARTVLPVMVQRGDGNGVLFCEPGTPKLALLRRATLFGVRLMSAVSAL